MELKIYSLPEAARVAGVSEDELRCAIKDGMLRARYYQNTWEFHIHESDLDAYLQSSRREATSVSDRRIRKVLIIDDEINFGNLMKIEFERDPRIKAKFATWGKDGITMADRFSPNLILIDYMLPDITGSEVLAGLRRLQNIEKAKLVVYSAHTEDSILHNPTLQQRLRDLGAEEFLSKTAGMRHIIVRVYELLGLDTRTRILRKIR